ncbi:hypothetical protein FHR85_000794 [Alkalibacillus almallahensis]|nr:hypothetical protein [Alkalibacillus almallahensis]
MEYSISLGTYFWLFVPMLLVVVLSFISWVKGRDKS